MNSRILHITPDFNYVCGRSKLVYFYLKHFSKSSDYETHFITNGGDSLDRLNDIPNLQYKILDFSTGYKNIFYKDRFYRDLKGYMFNYKINLIQTHHRFPESVSIGIRKELNVKTVTSAHSFVKGFKRSSFKSDKIISVGNSVSNHLINNFKVEKEKIITLRNPIEKFTQTNLALSEKFKSENNISLDKKILLFVGRINRDKGYDILLKAYSIIREKNKNVVLVINGHLGDKKLERILADGILYVAPQREIEHLYSMADLVILPSRIDPFPFVMIEAGSFKKPFIGGNTGGIAEFIEDGKNGLLIDSENPNQLAEKIIYLLENPEIGKRMGESLYEKVTRLCDYNNYFSQVEKIYTSLLASE